MVLMVVVLSEESAHHLGTLFRVDLGCLGGHSEITNTFSKFPRIFVKKASQFSKELASRFPSLKETLSILNELPAVIQSWTNMPD